MNKARSGKGIIYQWIFAQQMRPHRTESEPIIHKYVKYYSQLLQLRLIRTSNERIIVLI